MPVKDKRVVVFTPYGRELTVSILYKYLLREHERGIVDEWWLLMNTDDDQESDVTYAIGLSKKHSWIKLVERPLNPPLHPKQMNTGTFYRFMTDPDTVFVRFDDDIVYVEPNAIERLVSSRIVKSHPFVVFPIIWNNAICSYYSQQMGIIPQEYGIVATDHCMEPMAWANPDFARHIHYHLINAINNNAVEELFLHHDIQLPLAQQFSVSCFAQNGSEYAETPVNGEEESWHTIEMPYATGRNNLIVANSLVSHYSFYNQRPFLLQTDILDWYERIADEACK